MQNSDIKAIIKKYRDSGLEHGGNKKRVFGKHTIIDNQVELDTNFYLYNSLLNGEGKIPFRFSKNKKQFYVCASNLTAFWELPRVCHYNSGAKDYPTYALLLFREFNYIKDLEGITPIINGDLFIQDKKLSLENIHKHIKTLNGQIVLNYQYEGPLLGTLLVNGLTRIGCVQYGITNGTKLHEFIKIAKIINNRLQSNRDVLECQEELITSGYNEYAKI